MARIVARIVVPGEPIPTDGLDEATLAAVKRAVGLWLNGVGPVMPGDVIDVPLDVAAGLVAQGWELEVAAEATNLSDLTVAELRALAADRGVELPDRAPKAELIATLEAAKAGTEAPAPTAPDTDPADTEEQ